MFKLKTQNVLFWIAAPTLFSRYFYNQDVENRISGLWKIHQYRTQNGLGGTKNGHGYYRPEEHIQERSFQLTNGLHFSPEAYISGLKMKPYLDNPFTRYNEVLDDYGHFHDDVDDVALYDVKDYERHKPFKAAEKHVVGESPIIPVNDDEANYKFYNLQGESLYTNPLDSNSPVVDHGIDEEDVWAFRKTLYNQNRVVNQFSKGLYEAIQNTHAPHWGLKLSTPAFYKDEKYDKLLKQWAYRLELEKIKVKQAVEYRPGDKKQLKEFTREIQGFFSDVRRRQIEDQLEDVYVTDHVAKAKQYNTLNEEEDHEFY